MTQTRSAAKNMLPVPSKRQLATQRMTGVDPANLGDMEKWGWQVFPKQWDRQDLRAMQAQAKKIFHKLETEYEDFEEQFYLRYNDKKRLSISGHYLGANKFRVAEVIARKLLPAPADPAAKLPLIEERCQLIVSRNGTKMQAWHVDTKKKGAFSVLHALNIRWFYIRDRRGRHKLKMSPGSVIVFRGGVCHAGAEHTKDTPSFALHQPFGFTNSDTSWCSKQSAPGDL